MWIITKDFLWEEGDDVPSRANKVKSQNFNHDYFYLQELVKFYLFDDDGELYYEGMMTKKYLDDYGFGPLDWAMADSGCTYMEYYENGVWKQL
jgi:hypothetical protein